MVGAGSTKSGFVRWLRRGSILIGGLAILLASLGATYQLVGTWLDTRRFPQQGRSVQAGPIKMNIDCTGSGWPTVILEQGAGAPAIGWRKVQPEIAEFTRVCSYDRAGYGWSEKGPMPRTVSEMAKELKALLDASGEKGPYILVAASLGGPIVRLYAGLYPNDVSGMVLVDASHEDQLRRVQAIQPPELIAESQRITASFERRDRILRPLDFYFGIDRFEVHYQQQPPTMPREFWEEILYLAQRNRTWITVDSEVQSLPESVAALSQFNLGDRPLIVLTRGKFSFFPERYLTKEIEDRTRDLWIHGIQAEEARLSTRGKQIVVADSDHLIMFERPDAVVSAVHEVWSELARVH